MGAQAVQDKLDIHEVIFQYAWACDNRDWALLRSVFTEDAHLDYSTTAGPAGGREEICAWLEQGLSVVAIQHVVTNIQVALDGDRATAKAMFYAIVHMPGLDAPITTGGYYNEEFARTADGWRISRLFEDNRWMHPTPPAAAPGAAEAASANGAIGRT